MKIKNAIITAIKFVLSLLFIIALILLIWALFTSMVKDYTSSVEPTIIVAIISGLGAIIVNAISKNSERKNQMFAKTKEKMVDVYEAFLSELDSSKEDANKKLVFDKFQSVFAVNSSDDTYKEFLALKESENKDTTRFVTSLRNELKVSSKKNKK